MQKILLNFGYLAVISVAWACKRMHNETTDDYGLKSASTGSEIAKDLPTLCGQSSIESLLSEAHKVVSSFEKSDQIASMVPDVDSAARTNMAALKGHEQIAARYAWFENSQAEYEAVRSRFFQGNGPIASLMQVEWQQGTSPKDCEAFCFNSRNAMIRGNLSYVDKFLFKRLEPTKAARYLKFMLIHELGHLMVDHYFLKEKNVPENVYFEDLEKTYIANHLLVDAVSITINQSHPREFAEVLGDMGIPQGDGRLMVNEDQRARIRCLQELPSAAAPR